MNAAEKADWERREAIRAARFEGFVQRIRLANEAAIRRSEETLKQALRRPKQLALDFAI